MGALDIIHRYPKMSYNVQGNGKIILNLILERWVMVL